jgi:hypothetical protein
MPKRKPNPNQKVMRVHAKTKERIEIIAHYRGVTPPIFIDEMLQFFVENISNVTPGRRKVSDGTDIIDS